ncbi:MAG: ABC transporter permease [Geminicoccaceae bacterium]
MDAAGARSAPDAGLLRYLLRHNPVAVTLVAIFVLAALFGPMLAPFSMTDTDLANALQGPSAAHLLGTDALGRDVLSRVLGATRVAAQAFLIVVLIGGLVGTTLGILAGGLGGVLDLVVSRVVEVVQGFPTVLVAIVIVALTQPTLIHAMTAVGVAAVPDFARVARGVAIQLRDREFVEAARGLGASELRILVHEILPLMTGPLIVVASFDGAQAVLWETALSYLGLGVQPPAPSFGSMLSEAQSYLSIHPWLTVVSGVSVAIVILGLNLMGDALSDYYERNR